MTTASIWTTDAEIEHIISALMTDGAIILKGVCSGEQLQSDLAPYFNAVGNSKGSFYGSHTRRIGALIGKSALCRELAIHPVITAIVGAVLSAKCDRMQLNLTQGISIGAGEAPQILHRDDQLFPFEKSFESMVNVLWAVDDFTKENGGTRYILGSHTWDRSKEPVDGQTQAAEMSAGSCLIYMGGLLHAGGANRSSKARRGAVISYNLGWLRQAENFYLSVPWDAAQHYPDTLLKLMGYQLHRPNIGWVEGIDPLEWIRAGRPQVCAAVDALTDGQQDISKMIEENPNQFSPYLT